MIGRQAGDQSQLFSLFNREERIPARHLRRRINPIATRVLADLSEKLKPFHRETGRPSIDPELMLKMLIVGCCYGIRFERKLCEEVELPLAYRWFCRLALDDKFPHHATFSVNRHGRLPMPTAIPARRRTRSIGQDPSARRARSPRSWS